MVSREPLIVSPDDFVTAAQLQLVTYAENIHRLDTEDLHLERIALLQDAEELAACADDPSYQFLYIPSTFGTVQ